MNKQMREEIDCFQKNLTLFRKVAGWSAEKLAKKLDVSRQTVVNLETGQTRMTKVQYMAIRLLFMAEICRSENWVLYKLIDLVTNKKCFSEKKCKKAEAVVEEAVRRCGKRGGSQAAGRAAVAELEQAELLADPAADAAVMEQLQTLYAYLQRFDEENILYFWKQEDEMDEAEGKERMK